MHSPISVGEARAYVQGATLKARALSCTRVLNSPTLSIGATMVYILAVYACTTVAALVVLALLTRSKGNWLVTDDPNSQAEQMRKLRAMQDHSITRSR